MMKQIQPAEKFIIEDVETLKVVADSRRMQVLHLLKTPKTVKDLAGAMGMEASKLYYHVKRLEKHGLIQVVATNVVSGIIEKQYQISALEYSVDRHLLMTADPTDRQIEDMLEIVFDATRDDVRRGIKAGKIPMYGADHEDPYTIIARMVGRLQPAQVKTFVARLEVLMGDIGEAEEGNLGDDGQLYGMTLAFYPLPVSEEEKNE